MTQLVEDILETLALDSGKGAEVWAPVSVTEVIRAVQDRYQHQAQAAELTLEAVSVPDLPLTYGDEARLTQALGELVENAVVFTPPGGRVTIRTDLEDDRWITVAVEDTGPGMPEEDMGHLFERFFRGHLAESGHTAGVGLGLPIARQIAEAHGGEITVRSTEGRGSIFTLRLRAVAS